MDLSVIIATHGDRRWVDQANGRALPSVAAQSVAPAEVVLRHHPTMALHEVRNWAAKSARGEWLCFLDADDQLDHRYVEAMVQAETEGALLAPSVSWATAGVPADPVSLARRDIAKVNPCVIGTLVRRSTFLAVGGFWDWPAWEDWCLFRRCWLAGERVVHVPDAVYVAHVSPDGRNSSPDADRRLHRRITDSHHRWQRRRAA